MKKLLFRYMGADIYAEIDDSRRPTEKLFDVIYTNIGEAMHMRFPFPRPCTTCDCEYAPVVHNLCECECHKEV